MDNFQLVVGSTDCPVHTVVSIIQPSAVIGDKWSTFAKGLNVGSEHISDDQNGFWRLCCIPSFCSCSDKIPSMDTTSELLELWVAENGSGATLGKLLHVVEGPCGANDVGESIRLHFRLPCKGSDNNPSIEWNDIPPRFQNRITETIQKFFPTMEFSNTLPNLQGPALICLMTGKKPQLFVHPFPETLPYYINRTLTTRNIISRRVFGVDLGLGKDIFLFTGLDSSELSALAGNELTGTSTSQLPYSLSVRFMILDKVHHFEKICDKTKKHSVHLLRREDDGRLRWIRSSGEMGGLKAYVDKVQDEFGEKAFCRHLGSDAMPVLICGSPGMGKSVLLAQIGATLGLVHPDRTVIFIVFTEFIKRLKSISMNNEVEMIEIALQELTGKKVVHSNSTEERIVTFELLLDGFDEVDSADYKLASSILQRISTLFKSIRLWVTSRPHLMKELENSLNVLGYNIRPFDEQDQVKCLSSFWSRTERLDKQRIELFAKNCLKSKMDSRSQDIAGVSLKCLLIGEVYEDEAVDYARLGNEHASLIGIEIGTITDLYRRFIKKKIEKYEFVNGKLDEDELMAIHARLGLHLLFSDKMEALKLGSTADESDIAELLKIGILVKSSGVASSYAFLHRTFAEYFAAWFVLDKLGREGEWTEEISDFFLNSILKCQGTRDYLFANSEPETETFKFEYPVICYFLNSFIAGKDPSHLCSQLETESAKLMNIAYACANGQLGHIFKLFHERFESDERHNSTIYTKHFLLHSIQHSSCELVKLVVSQLEKDDEFSMQVQGKALSAAVQLGKLPIVEFLIKEKGLRRIVEDLSHGAERLVHDCIANTLYGRDEEMIESKIQVLGMLIQVNRSLLNHKVFWSPPLLFKSVHVKLLMELVRLGADVFAADKENYTVLHNTGCRNLCASDYHSLIMSIPNESLRELVHREGGEFKHTPLTMALLFIDPAPETLEVFHRVGADFNYTDVTRSSVVLIAVVEGRSGATIRKIIQLGGINVKATRFSFKRSTPCQSTTLLHIAAECGNVEAVGVLLDEYGMDVNSENEHGLTPLDMVIRSRESRDRFATGLALKERGGRFKNDKSLLHDAAASDNIQSVRLLISLGVDVNGRDEEGDTALHKFVEPERRYSPNEFNMVQLLVHGGADVTAPNKLGNTPFHTALKNEKLKLNTFLLLKSKTDETMTPAVCNFALKLALREDALSEEQFVSILNNFFQFHQEDDVCLIEHDVNIAVHVAAAQGHHRALQLLVSKGADINVKNELGQTPLHVVGCKQPTGYMIMVRYLVERVDVYAKANDDLTFLHQFILTRPSPSEFHLMVECLVEADVINLFNVPGGSCRRNHAYNCGALPFQLAVGSLTPEIRTLELLQPHVDFNAVDQLGHSILVNAIGFSLEFISTLINRFSVDWRIIDRNGWSILHHAAFSSELKSPAYVKFYLELGELDVNLLNNEGETPLFCAVRKRGMFNILENCKLLVAHGADVNIPNNDGVSPLAVVESNYKGVDKAELVELLRSTSQQSE